MDSTSSVVDIREPDLAAAYVEFQSLLADRPEVADFLSEVATLAASVVSGASCGITMRRDGEVATAASSDEFAGQVDALQYGRVQGPCLQSLNTGDVISVPDLADDDRWGEYRIHALSYGVRSSLSLPLTVGGITRGALNLYARQPDSFGRAATERCAAFARQAGAALTIVLGNTDPAELADGATDGGHRLVAELEQLRREVAAAEHKIANLEVALASSREIGAAIGIVMNQRRISNAAAFDLLRQASQRQHRKIREVAADVLYTGALELPRPRSA